MIATFFGYLFLIFLLIVFIWYAIIMRSSELEFREQQQYKKPNPKNRESILKRIKTDNHPGKIGFYSYMNIDEASDLLEYDLNRYDFLDKVPQVTLNDYKNKIFQEKIFLKIFLKLKSLEDNKIIEQKFNLINHENEINYLDSLRKIYKFDNQKKFSKLENTENTLLKRVRQANNLKKFEAKFLIQKDRKPDISEISEFLNYEKNEINQIAQKGETAFQQLIDIYSNKFRKKFYDPPLFREIYAYKIDNLIDLTEIEKLWECFFISSIVHFNPFENLGKFENFAEIWITLGFEAFLTPKIRKLYKQGKVFKNFKNIDIDIFKTTVFKNQLQVLRLNPIKSTSIFFYLFRFPNEYISFFNLCNYMSYGRFISSSEMGWVEKMDFIRILFYVVLQIEDRNTNLRFFSLSFKSEEIDFNTRNLVKFVNNFDDVFIKLDFNENEHFFDDEKLKKSLDSLDN